MGPGVDCCNQSAYYAYFTYFTYFTYPAYSAYSAYSTYFAYSAYAQTMIGPGSDKTNIQKSVRLKWTFNFMQGTFNCGILVPWVGKSGDPRRKWEEMGAGEG